MIFVETSAVARWYLPELRSVEIGRWFELHAPVDISTLAIAEMRSVLARKQRTGDLDAAAVVRVWAAFQAQLGEGVFVRHEVADRHVAAVPALIDRLPDHPLRTLDALYLAHALDLHASAVVTADRVLANAAAALSFDVVRFDGP